MNVLSRFLRKASGLYITRPILNAQAWLDWMAEIGLPNAVTADELYVVCLASTKNVKVIPDRRSYVINLTVQGAFMPWGESDEQLVIVWDDWHLSDRHWSFRASGCDCLMGWDYRATLMLSPAFDGFELTEEMLNKAPVDIVIGPERYGSLPAGAVEAVAKSAAPETVEPAEADQDRARTALEKNLVAGNLVSPLDIAALRDVAEGRTVSKSVLQALEPMLAGPDAAIAEVKKSMPAAGEKLVQKSAVDLTEAQILKTSDDEQVVYMWASMATVDGQPVKDLEGDEITVAALHDYAHKVMKAGGASKFEHIGENVNEIQQVWVFDNDIQKALGIDLGCEGMMQRIHVPDAANWEIAKNTDIEASIAGLALVEEI